MVVPGSDPMAGANAPTVVEDWCRVLQAGRTGSPPPPPSLSAGSQALHPQPDPFTAGKRK